MQKNNTLAVFFAYCPQQSGVVEWALTTNDLSICYSQGGGGRGGGSHHGASPYIRFGVGGTLNSMKQHGGPPNSAVSRLGLVVRRSAGKRKDPGSTLRFGSHFSLLFFKVVCGHCLAILPCTINETSLLILRKSFRW